MSPRKPKRPAVVVVEPIRARPIRGPHKDGSGRWYWQGRVFAGAKGGARTVWTGWALKSDLPDLLKGVDLKTAGVGAAPVIVDVRTVRDLLEVWTAAQEDRPNLSRHTVHGYRAAAKNVAKVVGDVVLERVEAATVYRLRDDRLRAAAATGTVDLELGVLKMAWRWGREMGFCPARELPRTRLEVKPVRNRHTPSREDVVAVVRKMSGWPRLAVILLFATGARIGDIAGLTWADVDLDESTVRLGGKTGERTVPLPAHVVDELHRARAAAPSAEPRVFGVRAESVKGQLRVRYLPKACTDATVKAFTAHALRRAAVDSLLRAGVDVGTAAALLGHSPKVMLEHYRRVTMDDRRLAVAKARLGSLGEADNVVPFSRER